MDAELFSAIYRYFSQSFTLHVAPRFAIAQFRAHIKTIVTATAGVEHSTGPSSKKLLYFTRLCVALTVSYALILAAHLNWLFNYFGSDPERPYFHRLRALSWFALTRAATSILLLVYLFLTTKEVRRSRLQRRTSSGQDAVRIATTEELLRAAYNEEVRAPPPASADPYAVEAGADGDDGTMPSESDALSAPLMSAGVKQL